MLFWYISSEIDMCINSTPMYRIWIVSKLTEKILKQSKNEQFKEPYSNGNWIHPDLNCVHCAAKTEKLKCLGHIVCVLFKVVVYIGSQKIKYFSWINPSFDNKCFVYLFKILSNGQCRRRYLRSELLKKTFFPLSNINSGLIQISLKF